MVQQDPESPGLLLGAADLYLAFTAACLWMTPTRAALFADKAMGFAAQGSRLQDALFWRLGHGLTARTFEARLAEVGPDELATLNAVASVWVGWMQANSDDWNAIAQLGRVRQMIERVVALDPDYEQGAAQLYLGVLHTLPPPLQGGKPELGLTAIFRRPLPHPRGATPLAKTFCCQRTMRASCLIKTLLPRS